MVVQAVEMIIMKVVELCLREPGAAKDDQHVWGGSGVDSGKGGEGELGKTKPSKRDDDDWMNVEIQGKTRSTVHAKGLLGDMSCRLMALWFRTTKNPDASTGQLARLFARWLTLLTHSLLSSWESE